MTKPNYAEKANDLINYLWREHQFIPIGFISLLTKELEQAYLDGLENRRVTKEISKDERAFAMEHSDLTLGDFYDACDAIFGKEKSKNWEGSDGCFFRNGRASAYRQIMGNKKCDTEK